LHLAGDPSGDTERLDVLPWGAIVTYRLAWFAIRLPLVAVVHDVQAAPAAASGPLATARENLERPTEARVRMERGIRVHRRARVALRPGAIDAALAASRYVGRAPAHAVFAGVRLDPGWAISASRARIDLERRRMALGVSVETSRRRLPSAKTDQRRQVNIVLLTIAVRGRGHPRQSAKTSDAVHNA